MKEGWTYKKLGEVCNIDFGNRVVKSRDAGSIYPVYGGGGATFKMDTFNREDCVVISRFGMSEQCTRIVKGKFFLNDSGLTLSLKNPCMVQPFMDWQILSLNNKIYSLGRGAAQKNLDTKALAELTISYPEISKQEQVVERLDAAFENIDKLKANAEKQLAEAQTLFQKSLAKAMEPKEGWEEKKLGDVCKSVNYGTSLPSTENGKYKYLRMNNITIDGTLDLTNLKTIDVPEKDFEKCVVRKGDLLFNRTNSPELVGKTCIFEEDEEMIIAGYIIRIRFNDSIYPQFASYFINLQRQLGNLRPLIVGAVHQANISAKAIQSINIQFPPLAEQQRIVERLDALSENIRKYESQFGEIRLPMNPMMMPPLKPDAEA